MMTQVPKISVCVPVFNGERYLAQLLDSVLAQSFRDFEFLISDNCSTDRTRELCLAYAGRDARIVYSRNERNIGANANSELLVHKARGDYWVLFGHDDVIQPTFLEKCLVELEKDPALVLCHALTEFIGPDGEPVKVEFRAASEHATPGQRYEFRHYSHVAEEDDPVQRFRPFGRDVYFGDHHYGLTRRSCLLKTRLFEPYYGSDTVMLAELALMGRFKTIDEVLFLRRIHRESSFYLTAEEQQEFAAPGQRRRAPGRLSLSLAYGRAVLHVDGLRPDQRLRCLATIAGRAAYALRNRVGRAIKDLARPSANPRALEQHDRQA
jgi:glycosyltransferase involved in cell wall biosynthesis